MPAPRVKLDINGKMQTLILEPRVSLLDALRKYAGMSGTRKGCDRGQCCACTVLVNGRRCRRPRQIWRREKTLCDARLRRGVRRSPHRSGVGTIRVPRIVGAYGVGRVMNRKTAHSQLMGGIVWGMRMGLMEKTEMNWRFGRAVNANLADYHVPVNADIGAIDIVIVDEQDKQINELGARGVGEIGITGVAAAIANAVYHATDKQIRDLPITPDKVQV